MLYCIIIAFTMGGFLPFFKEKFVNFYKNFTVI